MLILSLFVFEVIHGVARCSVHGHAEHGEHGYCGDEEKRCGEYPPRHIGMIGIALQPAVHDQIGDGSGHGEGDE